MAQMWPSRIRSDTVSTAERRLFETMHSELGAQWTVLHSVGLAIHDRKPWAEIDFVLVGPSGVFCLEVKGGRIRRENGRWIYTDRYGIEHGKDQGPFEQVGPAAAALRRHLVERNKSLRDVLVGYAVATPDVRFEIAGPDVEPSVVYDISDTPKPFVTFIRRVATYWSGRLGEHPPVPPTTRDAIVDLLRGDFDLQPSLSAMIRETESELVRLTEQQTTVMRGLASNDRVLVNGGAGTGKTFLAVAEATRLSACGRKVLLTCFSRRLADRLSTLDKSQDVTVRSIHALMFDLVRERRLEHRLPRAAAEDLFDVFLPELATEVALDDTAPRYDAIVIDEAQDLLSQTNLDFLDSILDGGIARGVWRTFFDGNQNVFSGSAPEAVRYLRTCQVAEYRLETNCRNTLPIGTNTAMLACVRPEQVLTIDGPDVEINWWRDRAEQARQLGRCIARLISAGVPPRDIVVLSRHTFERSGLHGVSLPGLTSQVVDYDQAANTDVRFSTIVGFKGLESPVVFVIDVDALGDRETCSLMYVGLSRAEVMLTVFIDQHEHDRFEELARTFGERLAGID